MIRTYLLPLAAAAGLVMAVRAVRLSNQPPPTAQPAALPARPVFDDYVAGVGVVEANTENIAIAPLVSGVVAAVRVKVGQTVKAGEVLFELDRREREAEQTVSVSAVGVAEAALNDARAQLALWEQVKDARAISLEELIKRRNAAALREAELARARAQAAAAQTALDLLTVRAPVAGEILQINVRAGEFAAAQAAAVPLILMGNTSPLHIRVDIDENDAWRIRAGMPAEAAMRGNSELRFPLEFVRIEPYVVPKRSLSGDSSERVDTRVLRLIYRIRATGEPLYTGQLMDVFIQAGTDATEE